MEGGMTTRRVGNPGGASSRNNSVLRKGYGLVVGVKRLIVWRKHKNGLYALPIVRGLVVANVARRQCKIFGHSEPDQRRLGAGWGKGSQAGVNTGLVQSVYHFVHRWFRRVDIGREVRRGVDAISLAWRFSGCLWARQQFGCFDRCLTRPGSCNPSRLRDQGCRCRGAGGKTIRRQTRRHKMELGRAPLEAMPTAMAKYPREGRHACSPPPDSVGDGLERRGASWQRLLGTIREPTG